MRMAFYLWSFSCLFWGVSCLIEAITNIRKKKEYNRAVEVKAKQVECLNRAKLVEEKLIVTICNMGVTLDSLNSRLDYLIAASRQAVEEEAGEENE